MTDKLVKKVTTGEIFIETDWAKPDLWNVRLNAWRIDHSQYCPMPEGHRLFIHPEEYGCVPYEDKRQGTLI